MDADVLGLAKTLVEIRRDVTYPSDPGGPVKGGRYRPACPIAPATPDRDWIPETARQGWLIITRDRHIQSRPRELSAVREYGARMVALAARDAMDTWHQLETLLCQWRAIEALHDLPGPFIYTVTRTAIRRVRLG
jgi:hypothetical protein